MSAPVALGRIVKSPPSSVCRVSRSCCRHYRWRLWLEYAMHAGFSTYHSHRIEKRDKTLSFEASNLVQAAIRARGREAERHVAKLRFLWKTRTAVERRADRKDDSIRAMRHCRPRKARRTSLARLAIVPRGLLKLPPELRNAIYELLVLTPSDTPTGGRTPLSLFDKNPAITQVNKQIRAEALAIYCGDNEFLVCLGRIPNGLSKNSSAIGNFHNYNSFIGWLERTGYVHAGYHRTIVCCFSECTQPLSSMTAVVRLAARCGLQKSALHWAMSRPTLAQIHAGYVSFVEGVFHHKVSYANPMSPGYERCCDEYTAGLLDMVEHYLDRDVRTGLTESTEASQSFDLSTAWLERDGAMTFGTDLDSSIEQATATLAQGRRASDNMIAEIRQHLSPGSRGYGNLWFARYLHAMVQSKRWLLDAKVQIDKCFQLYMSRQPRPWPVSAQDTKNWLGTIWKVSSDGAERASVDLRPFAQELSFRDGTRPLPIFAISAPAMHVRGSDKVKPRVG